MATNISLPKFLVQLSNDHDDEKDEADFYIVSSKKHDEQNSDDTVASFEEDEYLPRPPPLTRARPLSDYDSYTRKQNRVVPTHEWSKEQFSFLRRLRTEMGHLKKAILSRRRTGPDWDYIRKNIPRKSVPEYRYIRAMSVPVLRNELNLAEKSYSFWLADGHDNKARESKHTLKSDSHREAWYGSKNSEPRYNQSSPAVCGLEYEEFAIDRDYLTNRDKEDASYNVYRNRRRQLMRHRPISFRAF